MIVNVDIGPDLSVVTGYDGSCPRGAEGIRVEGRDTLRVFPSWREGEGISEEKKGRGFRFGLAIQNCSSSEHTWLNLAVDWQISEPHPRRVFEFLFIRSAGRREWSMIPGNWRFPVGSFILSLSPGVTTVGLQPRYNTEDLKRFLGRLERLGDPFLTISSVGSTREGRDIPLIVLSEESGLKKPTVLIMARAHGYETAGSYAVEGMMDRLNGPAGRKLRERFHIYVLPMLNPDGVYNGLSRLTDLKGADLNRVHTENDPAHRALHDAVDSIRPDLLIDLHHFLERVRDDVRCTDTEFLNKLVMNLPDQSHAGKYWNPVFLDTGSVQEEELNWCHYVSRHFGTTGLLFELPWYGRNTANMRRLGGEVIQSVLFSRIRGENKSG